MKANIRLGYLVSLPNLETLLGRTSWIAAFKLLLVSVIFHLDSGVWLYLLPPANWSQTSAGWDNVFPETDSGPNRFEPSSDKADNADDGIGPNETGRRSCLMFRFQSESVGNWFLASKLDRAGGQMTFYPKPTYTFYLLRYSFKYSRIILAYYYGQIPTALFVFEKRVWGFVSHWVVLFLFFLLWELNNLGHSSLCKPCEGCSYLKRSWRLVQSTPKILFQLQGLCATHPKGFLVSVMLLTWASHC